MLNISVKTELSEVQHNTSGYRVLSLSNENSLLAVAVNDLLLDSMYGCYLLSPLSYMTF